MPLNIDFERKKVANNLYNQLTEKVRSKEDWFSVSFFASYVFVKCAQLDNADVEYGKIFDGSYNIPKTMAQSIKNKIDENTFDTIKGIYSENPDAELWLAIILYGNLDRMGMPRDEITPKSIVDLAVRILDIKPGDKVADICCGTGTFLARSYAELSNTKCTGYEISLTYANIIEMRRDALSANENINIVYGDVFDTLAESDESFDKIFMDHPFGMKRFGKEDNLNKYCERFKSSRYDWCFHTLACEHLNKSGKVVAVSTEGTTWNQQEEAARKYFVDNGLVEAVISLPERLYMSTVIPTTIYVFSHENDEIRLIDASEIKSWSGNLNEHGIFDAALKLNYLSEENIDEILKLLENDAPNSIRVPKDKVAANEYNLNYRKYAIELPLYENGIKLNDLAEILRNPINVREEDNEDTGVYCLRLSDVEDGNISENLPSLSKDKIRPRMTYLQYGDIVVSRNRNRNADSIKMAINSEEDDRKIAPGDNFLIIRPNQSKIDPHYLFAFLMSEEGQLALDLASTGTTIRLINNSNLGEVIIPVPDMEIQKNKGELIKSAQTEIRLYKRKLALAKDKIGNAYYREEG